MDTLVQAVSDGQLWHIVAAISSGRKRAGDYRLYGVAPNLLALALARAKAFGVDDLSAGLESQLDMHAWWAGVNSGQADAPWPGLPEIEPQTTWRTAGVRILGVLLRSWSAEVLTAALEGLHAFVDADPSAIPDLYAELADEWPRYWLLHAAEVWAARHPGALAAVCPALHRLLAGGSFVERLQSWIVLCRLADVTGGDRPPFPLPPASGHAYPAALPAQALLLDTPGVRHGHARLSDRYSAARALLSDLRACGWDFYPLEGVIAASLLTIPAESNESQQRRPHRRNDFYCHNLRTETAVGQSIAAVLAGETWDRAGLPYLAQGFLGNDEPWLQRCPPRRAVGSGWPVRDEYGPRPVLAEGAVKKSLRAIATSLDVPAGWKTFAARVLFYSWDRDYLLCYWYESASEDGYLSSGPAPTCPGSRTFLSWLGGCFEPPAPNDAAFVSGFFAGGRLRLKHDELAVRPSDAWRSALGWSPDPLNPLVWRLDGRVVARYDRLHGPLSDTPQSPNHRQPVVDRWIVSDAAFDHAGSQFGPLRGRDEFGSYLFRGE